MFDMFDLYLLELFWHALFRRTKAPAVRVLRLLFAASLVAGIAAFVVAAATADPLPSALLIGGTICLGASLSLVLCCAGIVARQRED